MTAPPPRPLLLASAPPPLLAGTDAVFHEIETLAEAFGGTVISLHPFADPARRFPMAAMGLTKLPQILGAASRCDLVHVFNPAPYGFPLLRLLRKPVVYTVTAALDAATPPRGRAALHRVGALVTSNRHDEAILAAAGFGNLRQIGPGHELAQFAALARRPPGAIGGPLKLLSASAPWNAAQFEIKGIDALLDAVALSPGLQLTLVLRGRFRDLAEARIGALGIAGRVSVLDGRQDMPALVDAADALILTTKRPEVLKAWPHSLLEGLAAGKPVIVSRSMPMAAFVSDHQCGVVVETVDGPAIAAAAGEIARRYPRYAGAAASFVWQDFSVQRMLAEYEALYRSVTGAARR